MASLQQQTMVGGGALGVNQPEFYAKKLERAIRVKKVLRDQTPTAVGTYISDTSACPPLYT